MVDPHVLEQAGFDQRLEAVVHAALIQPPVRTGLEVGTDGIRFDATITLNDDRRLGSGGRRQQHGPQGDRTRHGNHEQGGDETAP